MNKFNRHIALTMMLLLIATALAAQSIQHRRDKQELVAVIAQEIGQLEWNQLSEQPDMDYNFSIQKEKTIEKIYTINDNHTINIDNQYGKITINNWNRNEVKVTVRIRTAESAEQKAQDALDRVHIDETKSTDRISFKTRIASSDSNWWSALTSGGNNRALNIDYEVYLPKGNELTLTNRYGAIELDDRDGKVAISVGYGSLTTGRLTGKGNSLSLAYSKGDVDYLNEGSVSVRYGGFKLGEAERLHLDLSYTSDSEIVKINREADINLQYSGGFYMGLGSTIRNANVAASYSSVSIKPAADAAFNFSIAISYGGFDYDRSRVNISSKSERNTSKSYTGHWNRSAGNSLSVSSRYGAVSLK